MAFDLPATAARYRIRVSRTFAVFAIAILLLTGHSWPYRSAIDLACAALGFVLITVCTLGRLWSLAFISGRKDAMLVQDGPYSCTRNPLYVFSLVGAIGLGLASRNVAVFAIILLFFFLYYPAVIMHEERFLGERHGGAFHDYVRRVPRFLPKWSLYHEPESYTVQVRTYRRTFLDAMWFLWGFLVLEAIERFKELGLIQVQFTLP
ncbi:MAG: isoprenylcysteine carboxylmethyltransferase family protein [Planctomycetes bacterium]|nr:isoprenylcysteine carboxylmethyltransferase family protein [Planctomycetota bacterium]